MADKTIQLSAKEIQWLEAILMDDDKDDAIGFCKEVIQAKLRSQDTIVCGPKTVQASQSS